MAQSANTALYAIERSALDVLRTEHDRYMETQTLTPAFVSLLKATHDMVMKGAKQRAGILTDGKSPRDVLVELQQLVIEFQMLVDQENESAAETSQLQ